MPEANTGRPQVRPGWLGWWRWWLDRLTHREVALPEANGHPHNTPKETQMRQTGKAGHPTTTGGVGIDGRGRELPRGLVSAAVAQPTDSEFYEINRQLSRVDRRLKDIRERMLAVQADVLLHRNSDEDRDERPRRRSGENE